MFIGIPREIKTHEYRVGLTPACARELTSRGHKVVVEKGAGLGSGFADEVYCGAGAELVASAQEVFELAELIVKVKEPQPQECSLLGEHHVLFTYLHLAADPVQAELLAESRCTAIAYETVTADDGSLPLLAPMSEVAGRMSIQVGMHYMERTNGGPGVLLGGVPGVKPARVVVLGAGVSGSNAIRMAVGLEAEVTVFDVSLAKLRALSSQYGSRLKTVYPTKAAIEEEVLVADLIIGAVLVPGASAPRLITRDMVSHMRKGAVLVDVAIDQGGCFETSRPTTHDEPIFEVDGVIHYCVTNMPGALARTSTVALNNATLPYVLSLADKGLQGAISDDAGLAKGLNVYKGKFTHPAVARDLHKPYTALTQ